MKFKSGNSCTAEGLYLFCELAFEFCCSPVLGQLGFDENLTVSAIARAKEREGVERRVPGGRGRSQDITGREEEVEGRRPSVIS